MNDSQMLVGMLFHPVLPGEMHGEGTLLSQLQSLCRTLYPLKKKIPQNTHHTISGH